MSETQTFSRKYHAKNNPAAAKRDTTNPCSVCGWSAHMAIHDPQNFGSYDGKWAHEFLAKLPPMKREGNDGR